MSNWNTFYVQRMGLDGQGVQWPVKESVTEWGIFCKTIPFKLMGSVKKPACQTWLDEDGDEEFIPSTGLLRESYTIEIELGCKKLTASDSTKYDVSVNDVRDKVAAFIGWLQSAGMIKLYSTHTKIGRQYVRLESVPDDATWKNDNGEEWLIFKIVMKVNDPSTDIVYSGGSLVQRV
ncbi:hypothetical protein [Prevotella sp. E2-28]|uniref:hypothetical protein n=1 Tax=Prevotella sp. E2-28 TaxID=2913620 RepID=UPI001EDB5C0D|nr:hypothetical protein [Prevotella sp. E2-28]UKK52660.1 hypothetical protein L6465_08580 [Prevotella sp. E2-28]